MAYFQSPEHKIESGEVDTDRIYVKIKPKLDEAAINPEDFRDIYGDEVVDKDLDKVERLKEKFDKGEKNKLAGIFEWIAIEGIELNNWLGPDAMTIVSSKYDDYINGIDAIVEFQPEGNTTRISVALDVTIGMDEVRKKLSRIKEKIDTGELGHIKYFASETSDFKGELTKIPHAVIVVGATMVQELAEIWSASKLKIQSLETGLISPKKALSDHFIQFQIMDELILQFEYFAEYAGEIGNTEVQEIFLSVYEKILNIKKERIEQGGKINTGEREEGLAQLKDSLRAVFKN